jgi:alanine racemase
MGRACKAVIDLEAIRSNYNVARRCSPDSRTVAVIKADAYGHGAGRVASALPEADAFGVCCIEEAVELRDIGISQPILLLQGFFEPAELAEICGRDLWTVVHCLDQVEAILNGACHPPLTVWLKIDTGMHRLGLNPAEFPPALSRLRESPNVGDIVLLTHFACSNELDNPSTTRQIEAFRQLTSKTGLPVSLANSGALLAWPDSHGDWNRPGFMLYGNSPLSTSSQAAEQLATAMTLQAEVVALRTVDPGETVGYSETWKAERPSRIATVSAGYGDGYPQQAPSGTPVLVKGRRAPLAGRVSMDMVTVDVTDLKDVQIGDRVVFWGDGLSVVEVADHVGALAYELLTRLPPRLPREYIGS